MKIYRAKYDALMKALSWHFWNDGINVYETNHRGWRKPEPMVFGVNWSAKGTQDPETTRKYADRLVRAAEICEGLNGLELEVVYEQDPTLQTEDDYSETVEKMVKALEGGYFVFLVRTLIDKNLMEVE